MDVTISLTSNTLRLSRQILLRALVSNDVTTELIIGLPSINYFNLLPIFKAHFDTMTCCEICSTTESATEGRRQATQDDANDAFTKKEQASRGTRSDTALGLHREMKVLFAEINAVTDNMATPTYTNEDELIQATTTSY